MALVPNKEGLVLLLPGVTNGPQLLNVKGFSDVNSTNLSQKGQGKVSSLELTTAVVLSQQPKGRRSGFRVQVGT